MASYGPQIDQSHGENRLSHIIIMLTSSSSYSNNIKVMMAIDITVTKYNLIHLN